MFQIGPITVYAYGLMIAIGVLAAYSVGEYRAKKYNLNPNMYIFIVVYPGHNEGKMESDELLKFTKNLKKVFEILKNTVVEVF